MFSQGISHEVHHRELVAQARQKLCPHYLFVVSVPKGINQTMQIYTFDVINVLVTTMTVSTLANKWHRQQE